MKILLTALVVGLLSLSVMTIGARNNNAQAPGVPSPARKRPPVFRATKEQVKQAQGLLKGRGLYAGESSGKLDEATRGALRKYQEAEGLKVTGTLNAATLEKMSIPLTERQKEVVAAQQNQKAT